MSPLQVGELAALGTAVLWTLSALAWTSAGRSIGVLAVCFLRLVIAWVFLVIYGVAVHGLWFPSEADARTWTILGISGFVGFFLGDLCLFRALVLIGPRLSLLIYSLAPPLTAILAWLALDDVLLGRHWLGMAVTLAGVAWVVLEEPDKPRQPTADREMAIGIILAILGAVGQAVGTVLSKEGVGNYDAVAATYIRVLGGMAGYLLLVTLVGQWRAIFRASRQAKAMLIVTFGSFVGPFLGVVLAMVALQNCPAGIVATIISTMPILILPFSILLHGEKVSLRAAGGALLSVLGVALLVL